MKSYLKLAPTKKIKVDERIKKCAERYESVISFYSYQDNKDKIHTVFQDSVDIYWKSVSNIIDRCFFVWEVEKIINNK